MTSSDVYRVLLVNDHLRLRRVYVQLLGLAPDLVVAGEADSGEEALEKIPILQPDIIVTDRSMPGVGGCQLTRQVRELYPLLHLRFSGSRFYHLTA